MHKQSISSAFPDSITIIGAGVSGLATAIFLARSGCIITVLEQRSADDKSGYGIQVTPNGATVLKALGFQTDAWTVIADGIEICCHQTGKPLLKQPLKQNDNKDSLYLLFHRADLVEWLQQTAIKAGVKIVFNTRVRSYQTMEDRVVYKLTSGETFATPYMIKASGMCKQQQKYNSSPSCLRCRYQAWRSLVSLPSRDQEKYSNVRLIPSLRGHLVTYPIRNGTILNVVAVKETDRTISYETPVKISAQLQEFRQEFEHFGSYAQHILQQCKQVERWTLPDSMITTDWSNNRLIKIGDALHPMLPFLAQGGNMALEDSYHLSKCLLSNVTLEDAHSSFRTKRETRIKRVISSVDLQSRLYHSRAVAVLARRLLLRTINTVAPQLFWRRLNWLFGYDVTADH